MAQVIDMAVDEDLERQFEDVRTLAKIYATAKGDRLRLEEFRKIRKNQLMKRAELDGYKAIGAQEREAYSHPEYEKLIKGLAEAVETESRALWELRLSEWRFEAWRTQQANKRMERNRYGA